MMFSIFAPAPPRGDVSLGEQVLHRLHLDGQLLLALVVLALAGLAILYGASNQDAGLVYRQSVRVAVSFVVLLVVAQISPQVLRLWSPWLFALGLLLQITPNRGLAQKEATHPRMAAVKVDKDAA